LRNKRISLSADDEKGYLAKVGKPGKAKL
jgi:hypothetical protein